MASEYDEIISVLILQNTVTVVVHDSRVDTLIAMVKKVKSERNRMRKNFDMPRLPKMKLSTTVLGGGRSSVTFELEYPIVF